MKRRQNQLIKKDNKLFLIFSIFTLITIVLVAFIFLFSYKPSSNQQITSYSTNSSIRNSTNKLQQSSNNDSSHTTNEFPYEVSFPSDKILVGQYNEFGFSVTTYKSNQSITVAYNTTDSDSYGERTGQVASLTPTTVSTQTIAVREYETQKNVHVNTELKLSDVEHAASIDFFTPFNGNDTKIYAYYMDNGNIALAFTPANADSYQVVVYQVVELSLK
ncbi:hypothetical protein KUA55_16250 [Enterococcus sp. ALS3]|uniref:Uncharacterized protein n=1 Tax=Enterococcus alishanensis TaxID=1303817 RepID=A0ABS6THF5_9ENTE|nr:hypothetical protein [Enterococcus alishanensis]MBV7392235.1 hypothetical protein [Enterococcus alishanensis]